MPRKSGTRQTSHSNLTEGPSLARAATSACPRGSVGPADRPPRAPITSRSSLGLALERGDERIHAAELQQGLRHSRRLRIGRKAVLHDGLRPLVGRPGLRRSRRRSRRRSCRGLRVLRSAPVRSVASRASAARRTSDNDGKRHVVDVEIEAHADGIGGHEVIDLTTGKDRPAHCGCVGKAPP